MDDDFAETPATCTAPSRCHPSAPSPPTGTPSTDAPASTPSRRAEDSHLRTSPARNPERRTSSRPRRRCVCTACRRNPLRDIIRVPASTARLRPGGPPSRRTCSRLPSVPHVRGVALRPVRIEILPADHPRRIQLVAGPLQDDHGVRIDHPCASRAAPRCSARRPPHRGQLSVGDGHVGPRVDIGAQRPVDLQPMAGIERFG